MTPGARVAAAIICLDQILTGQAAEQVLTAWGRQNRFAGSKDRAAIRDHVYSALRRKRSAAHLGGAMTGRGLMIGHLLLDGIDPAGLFTGEGHAPAALIAGEGEGDLSQAHHAIRADLPDWIFDLLQAERAEGICAIGKALRQRAPVFLRVNTGKTDLAKAQASLAADGIETRLHDNVKTALEVTQNAQKISQSSAYAEGLVELQDAASQAAIARLPLTKGARVLDYCAGGGGKALGIAAHTQAAVFAHDVDARRMGDIPARAKRAGADIRVTPKLDKAGLFDLVFVDAPCSGSGTWRRTPDAKWKLTPDGLTRLRDLQDEIIRKAETFVAPGGVLAYATCSIFADENQNHLPALVARGWKVDDELRLDPSPLGDGFYLALLTRN